MNRLTDARKGYPKEPLLGIYFIRETRSFGEYNPSLPLPLPLPLPISRIARSFYMQGSRAIPCPRAEQLFEVSARNGKLMVPVVHLPPPSPLPPWTLSSKNWRHDSFVQRDMRRTIAPRQNKYGSALLLCVSHFSRYIVPRVFFFFFPRPPSFFTLLLLSFSHNFFFFFFSSLHWKFLPPRAFSFLFPPFNFLSLHHSLQFLFPVFFLSLLLLKFSTISFFSSCLFLFFFFFFVLSSLISCVFSFDSLFFSFFFFFFLSSFLAFLYFLLFSLRSYSFFLFSYFSFLFFVFSLLQRFSS